ncbi:hypothetical protein [Candidatus Vondammii sp. HM_W22]|uniref:hypothetical protein n=1 Tax=Candidatus Vondammii sp. HM_W22 TaxID=2687299 RepID=UPI00403DB631
MSKNNVVKLAGRDTIIDPLTELPRSGAEQLIYQAVEAELLAEHVERRTEDGKAGVWCVMVTCQLVNCRQDWGRSRSRSPKFARRPASR